MPADDDLVIDPVLKMRSRFTRVEKDGADALRVETWIDPGGGVTPHIHPAMTETFEVLEGRTEFLSGRSWTGVDAGGTVVVEPGTRHAFRNRTDAVSHFVCHAVPPSSLEDFLRSAAAMSRDGAISSRALPTSFGAALRAAALADDHREMVTLLAPLPPPAVQRLVLPPLARLARRRGLA